MGSFLSSAAGAGAGAAGEVDHAARSLRSPPTIKECTRLLTNQELARLDGYDPVSFQELVARGNAGRPTLAQEYIRPTYTLISHYPSPQLVSYSHHSQI